MIASLKQINTWISKHNPKWLALIRVALGASFLLRGVHVMDPMIKLKSDVHIIFPWLQSDSLAIAIPIILVVGGFLMIIGLFTRFAAIIEIPLALIGIFYVNTHTEVFARPEQFYFNIVQILFCILFIIEGSGKLSLARYFKEADGEVSEDDDDEE